jgi:hypothetical protein
MTNDAAEFITSITAAEPHATVIKRTLAKLDPKIASNWLADVTVKNGHVAHTTYGELAEHLTFREFVEFYEALGCPLKRFTEIQDKVCKQVANGCFHKTGSTCDDSYC